MLYICRNFNTMKKIIFILFVVSLFGCKKYDTEPLCNESFNTYTYTQNFSFIANQNGVVTLYFVNPQQTLLGCYAAIVRIPKVNDNLIKYKTCYNDTVMLNIYKGDSIRIGYNALYNDIIIGKYDLKYICN